MFFVDPSNVAGQSKFEGWSLNLTAVAEPVNAALGIFAGVFVVGGLCRTQRVRDWLHRCRVAFMHWVDAV